MNRAEFIFPAVLAAVVGTLVGGGIAAGYSSTVLAFPAGAAAIVVALSLVQMSVTLTGRLSKSSGEELPPLTAASLAWVFALALFVYGLGFVAGPAAYLLAYLRRNGSSWLLSLVIAACSVVVTWGLFIRFLRVPLPIEPLWWG